MKSISKKAFGLVAAFCLFGLFLVAASCSGEKTVIKPVLTEDGGGGNKPPEYPQPPKPGN